MQKKGFLMNILELSSVEIVHGFKKKLAKYSNNIYMQALVKIDDNPNLTVTFFLFKQSKTSHPHWERKHAANGREHN